MKMAVLIRWFFKHQHLLLVIKNEKAHLLLRRWCFFPFFILGKKGADDFSCVFDIWHFMGGGRRRHLLGIEQRGWYEKKNEK